MVKSTSTSATSGELLDREFLFRTEFDRNGRRMLDMAPDLPKKSGKAGWAEAYHGFISYESAIDASGAATESEMRSADFPIKVLLGRLDDEGNIHGVKDREGKETVLSVQEIYAAHGFAAPVELMRSLLLQDAVKAVYQSCIVEDKSREWAREALGELIHTTQAFQLADMWFKRPEGSVLSAIDVARREHFSEDRSEMWIVNESGHNIRIIDQRGDDGCEYIRESANSISRIFSGDGERLVDGTFDYHSEPFVPAAGFPDISL